MNTKAESKVLHVQAKEHQRVPANHQTLREKHRTNSPSQPSEGTNFVDTLISDIWPPELGEVVLLLFEAPPFVVTCYGSPRKQIRL